MRGGARAQPGPEGLQDGRPGGRRADPRVEGGAGRGARDPGVRGDPGEGRRPRVPRREPRGALAVLDHLRRDPRAVPAPRRGRRALSHKAAAERRPEGRASLPLQGEGPLHGRRAGHAKAAVEPACSLLIL